jgi:subtilisin-like proprotein convertase family protein
MTSGTKPRKRGAALVAGALAVALLAAAPAAADTYTQSANVTIPPSGNADPYPSELDVLDQSGLIADVDVTLGGPRHDDPDDLDVMLVSPSGTAVVLMSDACGNAGLEGDLVFDQDAGEDVPDGNCPGGTFRPRDHAPGESWPAAPAGDLDAFAGESPEGTWQLYVSDDEAHGGEGDEYVDLWSLDVDTREPASVAFSVAAQTVAEGATVAVDVVRSGASPLYEGSVTVATSSGTAWAGLDFAPVGVRLDFGEGETTKRVEVPVLADGLGEPAQDFSIVLGNPEGDVRVGTPGAVGIAIPEDPGGVPDDVPAGDESPPPPRPFTAGDAFRSAPRARRCRRPGEVIRFRPRMPAGVAIVRSEVFVNGRRVEDNVDEAAVAPILLTMRGRRMRVRVRLHAHDGRVVSVRRTFRRCPRGGR